jgi:hypothetical protein
MSTKIMTLGIALMLTALLALTACGGAGGSGAEDTAAGGSSSSGGAGAAAGESGGAGGSGAEAGSAQKAGDKLTCTLTIDCMIAKNNIDRIKAEKRNLIPESGYIFENKQVSFTEGESVFDILARECRAAGIHMEYVDTPIYKSAYIEGIGNLYEFDGGELSGWMYNVNGEFPNYGCSKYRPKAGDNIEWKYTLDLGKDVGGGEATQG